MKIAVVNTKGGVGKTTSAIYLATAGVRQGKSVTLWDADPQGSATEWASDAQDSGVPLPFEVQTVNKVTVKKPESTDLTIIDTPPGGVEIIQTAIDASDAIIIPTTPSALDINRVWQTLESTVHKPAAVLVTSAELNTKLLLLTQQTFEEEGVFVFKRVISKRQDIRKAVGRVPDRLHGYDDVLKELMEVL